MTEGLEVLVQLVMAEMTTEPADVREEEGRWRGRERGREMEGGKGREEGGKE